jgi:hypothetical protein
MCMNYVSKLLTLVYAFYERKPDCKPIDIRQYNEPHWGQWTVIDEN